ncbi:hypothetical protein METBIDRAFT_33582 [Metschnikowia bicuspidata var. bicuspidata NRRL YB-4993]|uniref:Uncharacterized protein n=1 Tax=Metschnikowia bicuspidata var. bicuspidata NRRL YB-4993 TaxID=869754 RepID=A0A1A0H4V7_9ASCO|nr:hypothetical protein METBIDRAFT_33582 [Metschnikowia bicuspidata var. bicuspidata NRRL YB-4993]OBA18942.1 hypothetical protein METBIDRAFT_33582 [Metschnikowia bicuspidata var. bicuspidata NRRL YB-4993]
MSDDFERRPNPKGWVPPKAPYNPYDSTDIRPAEGYPSEFKVPSEAPLGFSSLPKNPTQYKKINETMKRLNYTPRPMSTLYPGQYMVLRKVDTNQRLNTGTRWFGTFLTGSILFYFSFFYRWNDGHENIMSGFYRTRLQLKEKFFGLNNLEYEDLYHPRDTISTVRNVRDTDYIPEELRKTKEGDFALNRPSERHVLEAKRIQQEQEEKLLREFDMHQEFAKQFMEDAPEQKKKKKFWLF